MRIAHKESEKLTIRRISPIEWRMSQCNTSKNTCKNTDIFGEDAAKGWAGEDEMQQETVTWHGWDEQGKESYTVTIGMSMNKYNSPREQRKGWKNCNSGILHESNVSHFFSSKKGDTYDVTCTPTPGLEISPAKGVLSRILLSS